MVMIDKLKIIEEDDGWQSAGALTDPNRELNRNEKRIPFSVDDYLANSGRYLFDSKRLGAVAVGEDNVLENASGRRDKRYGALGTRWKNWSLQVRRWKTVGVCDLPYARSAEES